MQRHICIALLLSALAGTAAAQVLNVRTGGWDLTVKSNSGGEAMEVKTRTCLKKEDLDAGAVFKKNEDAMNCKTTFVVRSATRLSYTVVCTGADASRSTMEISAPTPETMTIRAKTEGAGAGTVEATGRFASASCAGYDK
jgi:hypothetical protein